MTSSEEFNCLFCQDTFESKEELQIHFRKHGDPKFNQSVKSKPQAEMSASSGDKAEEGEVVNCDVCEEVFPTISKAITHKHKVHPDHDAKYFCPWCGKLFTMKHLYNKHIQSTHNSKVQSEETGFHCDYCEVDFFVPSAMVYHNKFFHRQDTELAAIGHSKKLKMFNQEPLLIYYCPFCGEEYCNKVNLHKHMGDDHIDENQSPEDVLRCPLCEAVFYHLDAYELHLTFHSSDDQYNEENELLKEITEFSLETVPPMMEKVENESQDDEPTGSVGIEELLLQGMNDSNDYDTNDEPKKKKKHKKHKKSKKTITLDEFLNMHSDVLGEGLDVEGIVEVPSQVVTKQLRKPKPHKLKAIKTSPSPELAKLKKAGIVIKKKPTPTTLKGMKIANKKSIVNTAQVGSKLIPPTQSKTDAKISSKDILSKLLSQSNSQIKIVKKSAGGITETSDKQSNEDSEKLFDDNSVRMKNGTVHDTINKTNEPNNETNNENCENVDMVHKSDGCSANDISSQESDNHCSTKDSANSSQVTIERKFIRKSPLKEKINSDKPLNNDINVEEQSQFSNAKKLPMHDPDTVNPLRNISQHITIKSLSSPKNVQVTQKQSVKEIHNSDTEEDNEGNNISNNGASKNNKSPLAALKHLSNLTIKSANQSKLVSSSPIDEKEEIIEKHTDNKWKQLESSDIDEENELDEFGREPPRTKNNPTVKNDADSTATKLNALKNLSKHITVKSMPQSPNSLKVTDNKQHENVNEVELEHSELNVNKQNVQAENINFLNKQTAIKNITNFKSPGATLSSPNNSPKVLKTQPSCEMQNQKNELVVYNPKVQTNVNMLKQFPNVTANPINITKNFTQKVAVQSSTQSTNVQKDISKAFQSTVKKIDTKQKQEIEIFNIEDSDDEDERNDFANSRQNSEPTSISRTVEASKMEKSMEVLKNLGKNITIKPKNQQTLTKLSFPDHDEMLEDETDGFDNDFDENSLQKVFENKVNTLLQNKLKSLGSITMKSNSSPKSFSSLYNSSNVIISPQVEEYDSDPETLSKVKITELPDDYPSDEDIPLNNIKNNLKFKENKQKAEDDMESNNDQFFEDNDDIETHIKPCTLKKPIQTLQKTPACLNNLKNLTVKSLKESNQNIDQDDQETPENFNEDNSITQNIKLNTLPFRQDISEDENLESTSNKPVTQQVRRMVNQNAVTSPNPLSTINKEVKVQTYQTKTVIEEVTTTVTKTIRTVNQTNQEVQNVSQIMSMNTRPQKIQGIRPNQQVKNFQGMSIRPAAPIRPRMRNPVMPTRPPASNIRPSNQLVPIRPGANVARLSNPRMPAVKKNITPSTSIPNKPVVGKPLKISPNALVSVNKRSAPDESSGPFSCFKKSKESLIPGLPSNIADDEGDSAVQFASLSHTSRSNFTSMTKTVKGNNSVTSTQMKSEICSSSEQLSRLNSMSGLKIVKTSQVKQASRVEERVEVDPARQSALNAIERLQKQGLLIKKPRVEEPDDSDHSNPGDGDDYYDT